MDRPDADSHKQIGLEEHVAHSTWYPAKTGWRYGNATGMCQLDGLRGSNDLEEDMATSHWLAMGTSEWRQLFGQQA